jgi:uncharacterized protein (TIGR02246 family)
MPEIRILFRSSLHHSHNPDPHETEHIVMTLVSRNEIREFALRYTAAWNSHDPVSVASFFSPQGVQRDNDGPVLVGREAIAGSVRGFMAALPDLALELEDVLESNGKIVYKWILEGTHSGTGKRVRFAGHEEWTLGDDGLVAESIGSFDEGDYKRQAGL